MDPGGRNPNSPSEDRAEDDPKRLRTLLTLAAGLAHEVNNALGAAMGFTEMALDELAPDAPSRPDLLDALGALDRSSRLVRQFLAACRSAPGSVPCLALNPLVKEAGKQGWLGLEIGRVTLEAPAELLMVRADPVAALAAVMAVCELAAAARQADGQGLTVRLERTLEPPEPGLANLAGWGCLRVEGELGPTEPAQAAAWRELGGGLRRDELGGGHSRVLAWLPLAPEGCQSGGTA